MLNLSTATKRTLGGITGLAIMGWVLIMSAYSMFFVARHLAVPPFFACGMSAVYDGAAIFAAYKSLQYAVEGRSGFMPRLWLAAFVAVSAWCNSLHSILGHESRLAIPMWACLPIVAAAMFELHTSQARHKARARQGYQYPAMMPRWASHNWLLFPLHTLDQFRDISSSRADALAKAHGWVPRRDRKAIERNRVSGSVASVTAGQLQPVTGQSVSGAA